ncbi:MAG: glycosyltransferase family 4 protein [Promicromonosporaceae bacterium]|nr:glycosyltransferase family 4 protein [Promicromonosporaceae bacterium]
MVDPLSVVEPVETTRPLTIGLLIDDSLDRPDGVQQYVLTLGAWLAERGHTVHYITASTERTDLLNLHVISRTVKVKFNGNTLGTPRPVSKKAAHALIAELDLDVLHVQMPYSPLLAGRVVQAAAGVRSQRRRGQGRTAIVGTFHIYPQSRLVAIGARALGLIERRRLLLFNNFLAVSEAAQDFARSAFGIDTKVVGNPVDTAQFVPATDHVILRERRESQDPESGLDSATALAGARATQNDAAGIPHIVFLGRLVARKGPRELVAALGRLHEETPKLAWRASIAGHGPLLSDLQALGERLGIADRLSFPGFIAEEDKAELLQGADVIALPSTGGESFGISVVEALAAANGVVLAGDNPGYRTVMRGLEPQLVNPADTATFTTALRHSLTDLSDSAVRATIVAAQRKAAQRFDVHIIGEQVEATYRSTLQSRARSSN